MFRDMIFTVLQCLMLSLVLFVMQLRSESIVSLSKVFDLDDYMFTLTPTPPVFTNLLLFRGT